MSSVTILSPVRNRPGFFSRLIHYLERVDARFPVLVGDASKDDELAKSYEALAANSRLDVSYVRLNQDGGSNFIANLHRLARRISTDYYMWLCDDDFPVVPAVLMAARELTRTGASMWMGTVVDFRVRGSTSKISGNIVSDRWALECSGRYRARKGTVAGSVSERLERMERVHPFEAIAHVEVLRQATTACLRANVQPWWGLSQALSASALVRGPVLSRPEILLFRQENTPHSAGSELTSVVKPTETAVSSLVRALVPETSFADLNSSLQESKRRHFEEVLRPSPHGELSLRLVQFSRRLWKRLTERRVKALIRRIRSVKRDSSASWVGALLSAQAIISAGPRHHAPMSVGSLSESRRFG